ncbi:proline dehydrogenase [Actinoplanes sp. SE50]|uniref:proline dehydrogenase family protein n=1 Tax=unclassified Actinoplanes TaxID=2626549 RepID=UPI00023EDEA4|nr:MULTISPECIES: proline dehydrogenase family protein [unclassified Actinoplanes]AEV88752.1 proline dehydrogenase [Actinoplanes sp. SE50/110]ATO87158.1 proline dehydrogenase [Actinoplanes sp. SE50]SLM04576.1 proline dehydrogenase [Actinoplanes sp. SE50/110]
MFRSLFLAAAGSARLARLVESTPVSASMVRRFVAGRDAGEVVRTSRGLADDGLAVSVDFLGDQPDTPELARAVRDEYVSLLARLGEAGLAPVAEVSVKLSALGRRFDEKAAFEHARAICVAAAAAGTAVTFDAEDHGSTDATLEAVLELRRDFPSTGAVLQAYLRRTEADCRELATAGSRVRLCKGAYTEPESVAFPSPLEVDKAYVRCLNILMSGAGYPMVATHDPRLIAIAEDRARWFDRSTGEYEFQLLFGMRPEEQARLADDGHTVRVYLPYGPQWYAYLLRRLVERPAFLVAAVSSRK